MVLGSKGTALFHGSATSLCFDVLVDGIRLQFLSFKPNNEREMNLVT